jgi:hypothetical protein
MYIKGTGVFVLIKKIMDRSIRLQQSVNPAYGGTEKLITKAPRLNKNKGLIRLDGRKHEMEK